MGTIYHEKLGYLKHVIKNHYGDIIATFVNSEITVNEYRQPRTVHSRCSFGIGKFDEISKKIIITWRFDNINFVRKLCEYLRNEFGSQYTISFK